MKTVKRYILGIIMVSIALVACTSTKDKELKQIEKLKAEIKKDSTGDIKKETVEKLANAYKSYANAYSEDSVAPEYLFIAAGYAMNYPLNNPQKAIAIFKQIEERYPNYNKTPDCYFLTAFIYDNTFKDYTQARQLYNDFIIKYPNSDLVDDAQMCLKILGKSPETLMKEFEAKQAGEGK